MAKKNVKKTEVKKPENNIKVSEKSEKVKKPVYKKKSFWITTVAFAVVLVLTLVTLLDYSIISVGIKIACEPRNISTPQNYDEILEKTDASYDISYESEYGNGYFDIYTPKNTTTNNPLVLYIHGGYYIGGDKKGSEPYCRTLAAEGFTVASMNYGLAPKYKYPVQLKQINEILGYLTTNKNKYHVDAEQIFIGGDSAGGNLSAVAGAFYTNGAMAQKTNIKRSIDGSQIKGLLLLCGLYNMDTVRACEFPFLNTAMWALTDVKKFENYSRIDELNAVKNVTVNYPDVFLTCGGDDPFYTQAEEMAEVLNKNFASISRAKLVEYLPKSTEHKLKHEFQKDFSLPEANTAMEMAIEFLKERAVFEKTEGKEIHAIFTLDNGKKFDVLLNAKRAPETVANFIAYAEAGFYDNTAFHRILKGSVLQGGGYTYDSDTAEYKHKNSLFDPINGEFSSNGYTNNTLTHDFGTISMARSNDPNSATSQFFFCSSATPAYDGNYAAFGRIVNADGLEELLRLTDVSQNEVINPSEPIILRSVTIEYRDLK